MRTAKDQYILIRTILFCWTIFYSLNNSTSGSVYGPDQTVQKFKVVWALISHNYMTKPFSYGIALTNMDNNSIRNKKTQEKKEESFITIIIIVIKLIVISSECFSAYSDCDWRKGFLYPTRP